MVNKLMQWAFGKGIISQSAQWTDTTVKQALSEWTGLYVTNKRSLLDKESLDYSKGKAESEMFP